MAVDKSGEWWIGSEAADIEEFLSAYSKDTYPTATYKLVRCHCGSDRFAMERSLQVPRRTCSACGDSRFICRTMEDWEEAEEEERPEPYVCIECDSRTTNIVVGFAGYPENPDLDALKWFYVGVRCAECGILGCFYDGKIGYGPRSEVYRSV